MLAAKRVIPIRAAEPEGRYSLTALLTDGSVTMPQAELDALRRELDAEPEITRLLHPEVRYEVTDHCNATCIMCRAKSHAGCVIP